MRIRPIALSILVALLGSTLAYAAPVYYLALGDSLAIGLQPSATGDVPTKQGYVDDLFAAFRPHVRGLTLTKLGCSGETTTSMIGGGICPYAAGSQLAAAVAFVETHPVAFITLDIGANDIDHCISTTGIDTTCVTTALTDIGTNLPQILAALRSATGSDTPIIAMNYYNPFLAAWTLGTDGQALAKASAVVANDFNHVLQGIYSAFSVPVADVAHAFRINDFNRIPFINLPLNVFLTLSWTWMAAPPPLGPDIHPNAAGYLVIAGAFAEKIASH
ncbi:MAG TPA: SGNH/GDSL hydrolase family protein [Candidatus Sulfotelmatobacter sp.]|jgi:lysophospholipase L1-like esterase|nr:SGNH/GDSL hydrolase family protein [Candidatus Sulfotelmatobacter sp.]